MIEKYKRAEAIPEYRSVAQIIPRKNLHPVRDASLTGCKGERCYACATERFIPDGMRKIALKDGVGNLGVNLSFCNLNYLFSPIFAPLPFT